MGYSRCNVKPLPPDNILDPPEGWKIPSDVSDGKAVVFNFEYQWDGKNCTIKNLSWYPVILTENTEGEITPSATTFANSEFTQTGKLSIKFGNTNANGITGSINILNRTSSEVISTSTTIQNVEAKYLTATFRYIYTVSTEGKSDIEYIVEIKNIKIPKTSKYENNVVFTEEGVSSLLTQIKKYPIIDIETVPATEKDPATSSNASDVIWTKFTGGKPCIRIKYGDTEKSVSYEGTIPNTTGYKYVAVGSNIEFPNETTPLPETQATGTVRIKIDGNTHEIPVYGLSGTGSGGISLSGTTTITGHLLPSKNATANDTNQEWSIGSSSKKWHTLYALNGNFTNLTVNGNSINATDLNEVVNGASTNTTTVFWRGDASWSNTLTGSLTTAGLTSSGVVNITNSTAASSTSTGALIVSGGIGCAGYIYGNKVYGAVFNDYAEYRTTINLEAGRVVIDNDDGSLSCSSSRLQPGAQVISDTFGHSMGETDTAKTPLAVAGRVLVYTYQPRENYHAGMAVCSAPDGTVDIMTREEIRDYPDCIIGIVSEIPQYKTWGSDNVKVDGRIWIKVK